MIDLIVVRGAGDQYGADIENPMITTTPVALQKGRNVIDESSGQQTVILVCNYRVGIRRGQTVTIMDALQGQTWVGKVSGIAHRTYGTALLTELTVERPQ